MEIIFYWGLSSILSLLIVLGGVLFASLKLGFSARVSDCCAVWAMLSIILMFFPIINIIVGIITTYKYVKEAKSLP